MGNWARRTAIKRRAGLDAISAGSTIAEVGHHAGIGRTAIAEWRAADPEVARDFDAAYADGTDRYVAETRRRAFAGADGLLNFVLKCRDPTQFNQRMQGAVGSGPDAPHRDEREQLESPTIETIEGALEADAA